MCYTTDPEGVWRNTYVPKIIEPRVNEHYLLAEYAMSIGAIELLISTKTGEEE